MTTVQLLTSCREVEAQVAASTPAHSDDYAIINGSRMVRPSLNSLLMSRDNGRGKLWWICSLKSFVSVLVNTTRKQSSWVASEWKERWWYLHTWSVTHKQ